MLTEFKYIFMKNSFETIKKKLQDIAEEFNLDYEKLEKDYLEDIKKFIEDNK